MKLGLINKVMMCSLSSVQVVYVTNTAKFIQPFTVLGRSIRLWPVLKSRQLLQVGGSMEKPVKGVMSIGAQLYLWRHNALGVRAVFYTHTVLPVQSYAQETHNVRQARCKRLRT